MSDAAYYNEVDPFVAQWLRNLMAINCIAPGEVDERDIQDVRPDDLREFTQCHFFAGIGVWSLALRNAGWPDDQPVWTGSCPCQPFSSAGKRAGTADERHLWPAWFHLISECGPDVIFGEQVASKDGLGWLDLVQGDLEATGYASGAVDLCAAGVGAPHIRQRLWFVAERLANNSPVRWQCGTGLRGSSPGKQRGVKSTDGVSDVRLADVHSHRRGEAGRGVASEERDGSVGDHGVVEGEPEPGPTNGHWRNVDWLHGRDGKWRPVEPRTFPLAHGVAGRVGLLRAYGNAIVEPAARAFIQSYMEAADG